MLQVTVNMYLRKLHLAIGALLIESNLALCAQSVQSSAVPLHLGWRLAWSRWGRAQAGRQGDQVKALACLGSTQGKAGITNTE